MFEVNNGITKINGSKGKYDDKTVTNPSIRYGRNSVQNFYNYLEQPLVKDNHAVPPILDFGITPDAAEKNIEKLDKYVKENDAYLSSLPPLEYELRYMPNIHKPNEIDRDALLAVAYEELGGRKEVNAKEIEESFAINDNLSNSPLDINNDGKIDIGEYGSSILAADIMSNSGSIKGTINSSGHNAVRELTKKANAEAATQLYASLYNKYNLGEAAKNFNPQG